MTQFFVPLPGVSLEDRERLYGVWAKMCGKDVPPPHERIFRIWFTYQGRELFAEVGQPISPGEPPVVAIYGGDPLVVYRLEVGAFEIRRPVREMRNISSELPSDVDQGPAPRLGDDLIFDIGGYGPMVRGRCKSHSVLPMKFRVAPLL